jgi:hypothetical protein
LEDLLWKPTPLFLLQSLFPVVYKVAFRGCCLGGFANVGFILVVVLLSPFVSVEVFLLSFL